MKPVMMTCPQCGGSGHAPLTEILSRTLEVVPVSCAATTSEIFDELKKRGHWDQYLKQSAVNNRLTQLEKFGLIYQAERRGRFIFWKRTVKRSAR